jgi:hypothetical protein
VGLIEIPAHNFVALVFSNSPGRRLRFLFVYKGELRAVSWLDIGPDGSLYLNARTTSGKPIVHGSAIADGAGGLAVEWSPDPPAREDHTNRKVSYHASGRTKGGARMSTSISLRTLTQSTLIRQDDYAHPSRFDVIAKDALRNGDIVVPSAQGHPFELKDDARLTSRVFAAPLRAGDAQVAIIDDDPAAKEGQTAVVLPAIGLDGCQDLTFQVQFYVRPHEAWPEITTIAIPDVDESGKIVVIDAPDVHDEPEDGLRIGPVSDA